MRSFSRPCKNLSQLIVVTEVVIDGALWELDELLKKFPVLLEATKVRRGVLPNEIFNHTFAVRLRVLEQLLDLSQAMLQFKSFLIILPGDRVTVQFGPSTSLIRIDVAESILEAYQAHV